MNIRPALNAFNAGEWSPTLKGRNDLDKYVRACLRLENYVPQKQGGAFKRHGLEYLFEIDDPARLERFEFDTDTPYLMIWGDETLRIAKEGALLTDLDAGTGGNQGSLTTPYDILEVFQLQFCQSFDVVWVMHPNHPVYKLSRFADNDWTLAEVEWDFPALLDLNVSAITITPSAATGTGITLTASGDLFDASMVGGYFALRHPLINNLGSASLNSDTTQALGTYKGSYTFKTTGTWAGTIELQVSYDNGSNWVTLHTIVSDSDNNEQVSGLVEEEVLFRAEMSNHSAGPCVVYFTLNDPYITGFAKITAFTSATEVTADVKKDFYSTAATSDWYEGAWSDYRGYPVSADFFGDSLWFGDSRGLHRSVVGDYEDLERTGLDDGGIYYPLPSRDRNRVKWIIAKRQLLIGTSAGIWVMRAPDGSGVITPSNIRIDPEVKQGVGDVAALELEDVVIVTLRGDRIFKELFYTIDKEGFSADTDLTLLADHITGGGITDMTYQQNPTSAVWAVREDGALLNMIYQRPENVIAWSRHVTDGEFVSVEVLTNGNVQELYAVVKRTIDGSDVYYVERMQFEDTDDRTITVNQYNPEITGRRMQMAVLFDLSGSMDADLTTFKSNLAEIIEGLTPVVDLELALVTFGEDNAVNVKTDFTTPEAFLELMDTIEATSGSVEDGYQAIYTATQSLTWDTGSALIKSVFMLTDEDADEDEISQAEATAALNSVGAVFYYGFDLESDYGTIATATGGGRVTNSGDFGADFVQTIVATQFSVFLAAEERPIDYLDSYNITTGSDITSLSGLDHLEGESIYAVGDGAVEGPLTVSSGAVTLEGSYSTVIAGLPYTAYLQPMDFEPPTQSGSSRSRRKAYSELRIMVYKSLGISVGVNENALRDVSITAGSLDTVPPLETGDITVDVRSGNQSRSNVVVASSQPLPVNILGIYPILEVNE